MFSGDARLYPVAVTIAARVQSAWTGLDQGTARGGGADRNTTDEKVATAIDLSTQSCHVDVAHTRLQTDQVAQMKVGAQHK